MISNSIERNATQAFRAVLLDLQERPPGQVVEIVYLLRAASLAELFEFPLIQAEGSVDYLGLSVTEVRADRFIWSDGFEC